jgi:hypothetical protein
MGRIQRWLGATYAPWIVIAVGIALAAPALTAGFAADDHLHRVVQRADTGVPGLRPHPFDLFVFADGDPIANTQLRDAGVFPWWVDPQLKLAFFRPLSSATHALDHALWPDSAPLQQAQDLVWLLLSSIVAWKLFARIFDGRQARWIAVLALALYAWDDARGPVVGWIANRNALIAVALAVPVLLVHDRWRRDGWAPGRVVAPLIFAVALGAGESSIAILAYVAAHALWLDRAPWRDKLVALLPYLVVVVVWRVVYVHLGYGVAGSGIYLDPGADPIAFAGAAARRLPFLLLGQLAVPWSDLASIYPVIGLLVPMLAFAAVVLAAIAAACARIVRRDPVARFFATGMVLAAVPVCSTFPADRLLGFVGLGGAGLIAQLIAAALADRALLGDGRARRWFGVAIAILMIAIHVVLAPPLLVLRARSMVAVGRVLDRAEAGIPHTADGKTVIIATAPNDGLAGYILVTRASRGEPRPARLYWLSTATSDVTLERLEPRALRVTVAGGLLHDELDQMMRSPRLRPFHAGDRIALRGVELTIEAVTADGRPRVFVARFAVPLEDPSLVWLRWQDHTYVPYAPPALGARDTLPAADLTKVFAD